MPDRLLRPSWDEWFMEIARVVSMRSSCRRRRVGCVVVSRDRYILSTGYNGSPAGSSHCTDTPCRGAGLPSGQGLDLCEAVHAEQNAIARLKDVDSAHTLYCTTPPCTGCVRIIAATPISVIACEGDYAASGEEFWTEVAGRKWRSVRKRVMFQTFDGGWHGVAVE